MIHGDERPRPCRRRPWCDGAWRSSRARTRWWSWSIRATRAIGEALRDESRRGRRRRGADVMDERATDGTEPPPAGRRGDERLRRVHRADQPVAQPHARPQAGHRRGRARRDDARRHRGHARARDGGRLRHDGGALARRWRRCSTRGTRAHVTCPRGTDLELALDGRAGISDDGELTRPGRVRQPAVRRGVHRAGVRRGDDRRGEPRAARDQRWSRRR